MADLPPPVQDPDEVRRLAEEILARKAFQPPDRSILERVADWIGSLFDRSGGSSTPGSGGSGFGSVVLLVVAVAVLLLLLRAVVRHGWLRRRPATDPPLTIDVQEHRTAEGWLAAAAEHEAAGRWKDGLRCRFGALVRQLVDREVVPATPGRTARELAVDVRDTRPAAAEDFAEAAELFERAWYGDGTTGPAESERFAALADRVLAATAGELVG